MSWIPLAASVVQMGLEAIPTSADKYAEEERRKLEAHKGLTEAQRRLYEEQYMAPAQAAGREALTRIEGQLAAQGGQSAGQLQRLAMQEEGNMAKLRQGAGMQITAQDVSQTAADQARLDSIMAFKGQRQADLLDTASSAIGSLGKAYGAAKGGEMGYAKEIAPQVTEKLVASGMFTEDEATAWYEQFKNDPELMKLLLSEAER